MHCLPSACSQLFLLMKVAAVCQQFAKHPELEQLLQHIASGTSTGYLLFPGSGLYTTLINAHTLAHVMIMSPHCSFTTVTAALPCITCNCYACCISESNRNAQDRWLWDCYARPDDHAKATRTYCNINIQPVRSLSSNGWHIELPTSAASANRTTSAYLFSQQLQ